MPGFVGCGGFVVCLYNVYFAVFCACNYIGLLKWVFFYTAVVKACYSTKEDFDRMLV